MINNNNNNNEVKEMKMSGKVESINAKSCGEDIRESKIEDLLEDVSFYSREISHGRETVEGGLAEIKKLTDAIEVLVATSDEDIEKDYVEANYGEWLELEAEAIENGRADYLYEMGVRGQV